MASRSSPAVTRGRAPPATSVGMTLLDRPVTADDGEYAVSGEASLSVSCGEFCAVPGRVGSYPTGGEADPEVCGWGLPAITTHRPWSGLFR